MNEAFVRFGFWYGCDNYGLFAAVYAGVAIARVSPGQGVVEAQFVCVLKLLAVHAERLSQHDGPGFCAGEAVPVVGGFRIDRPAAGEVHVEAVGAQDSEEILATGMEAYLIKLDYLDLGWGTGAEDGELTLREFELS